MPDERKKELVDLLASEDIPLIEDDIYGDLCFHHERPIVAKAFDKKGIVLLCSSFSKTLAPGYRVGWVAAGRFKAKSNVSKRSAAWPGLCLLSLPSLNFSSMAAMTTISGEFARFTRIRLVPLRERWRTAFRMARR